MRRKQGQYQTLDDGDGDEIPLETYPTSVLEVDKSPDQTNEQDLSPLHEDKKIIDPFLGIELEGDGDIAKYVRSLNAPKSSRFGVILNFSNSIIGAGIIGFPYALSQAGFFFGIFLLVFTAVLIDFSIHLLIVSSKLVSVKTYQGIVYKAFGRPGLIANTLFQFCFAFGAMCAYLVIIGGTLPCVFEQILDSSGESDSSTTRSVLTSRHFWISITTFLVIFPLCIPKNISFLSNSSLVSLLSVLFIVFSVSIEVSKMSYDDAFDDDSENDDTGSTNSTDIDDDHDIPGDAWSFIHPNFFQAIGVISFGFVCHHNTFMLYESLETPTMDRFNSVTKISLVFSVICSLALAIAGYVTFFDQTEANLLQNFPSDNNVITVTRVTFSATMFLTYPLECFVAREVLDEFFFPNQVYTNTRHILWTLGLIGASFVIAMSTDNLGAVLELTGDFAASALGFILPGASYLKLTGGNIWTKEKIPVVALVVYGACVLLVGTTVDLVKTFTEGDDDSDPCGN